MIASMRREATHYRTTLSLGTSMSALGAALLLLGTTAAHAQTAPATDAPAADAADKDIVVTGFRASLQ
ncbi:hypothetical protein, partial [Sphingomonas sp.]|uniref:hypothetical protein n=1 Tax=Sphingomonas sp. TaxID=28214 RepID=UPI0033424B48